MPVERSVISPPQGWAADDHRPVDGAEKHLDDKGRVEAWVTRPDGREVVVVPGATSWRFYINERKDPAAPEKRRDWVEDPRYGAAISAHVYPSAQAAMDAGLAWHAHPYLLPQ